jgi:hypothetical protein
MHRPPTSLPTGPPAWLARTVVTGVCAISAYVVGILLGLTGLLWLVAIASFVLVWIATGPWRRAALPIATVIAFMTLGGLQSTRSEQRVGLSVGNKVEEIRPGELGREASFRQGFGSLTVDLRGGALRPGSTTTIHARSDMGSVVVALDRQVCTRVNLRWRPLRINGTASGLTDWMRSAGLPELSGVAGGGAFLPSLFTPSDPYSLRTPGGGKDTSVTIISVGGRYAGGPANFFGQSLSRAIKGEPGSDGTTAFDYENGNFADYRATRAAAGPDVAVLNLDLQAASGFIVRDYPAGINVRPDESGGGLGWPQDFQSQSTYASPSEPEDTFGDVRRSGVARGHWSDWERDWVRTARRRAVLSAGTCATRADRRDHWEWTGYAADDTGNYERLLAVNALGELVVKAPDGSPPASGSARALASATGTTLVDSATQRERLAQYRAANLPEAR